VLTTKALCTDGEVSLPFGHRYYLGLGLVVFFALVFNEIFGSPFMRNIQVPKVTYNHHTASRKYVNTSFVMIGLFLVQQP
jgi:hypothetical protein